MRRKGRGCIVSESYDRTDGGTIRNVDEVRGEVVARFVLLKVRLTA
jgi:hypothetical protein